MFSEVKTAAVSTWLTVCTTKDLFDGISGILHLALCCFVKAPLEATAESVGSVIGRYGSRDRWSLLPANLSAEIQVAWNGPHLFSPEATSLIEEALKRHFEGKETGLRFYVNSKLKLVSSTIASYMKKPSRIQF